MSILVVLSTITTLIALGTVIALFFYLRNRNLPTTDSSTSQLLLQRQIEGLNSQILGQLGKMGDQIASRLRENAEVISNTNRSVGERIDNAARAYASITGKLSQLEEANKRIEEVGKDISSLQDIFRSPKLRGGIGEHFLADILMQMIPAGQYELQYTFKTGDRVDAILKLRDGLLVPIDSKFPLEKIQLAFETTDSTEQERLRKGFITDVKKHIDKISKQYILPSEGTTNWALMWVPSENIFYEIIIANAGDDKSLAEYSHERSVIPVSPNSFYIYLQTILLGLRGMQIEKAAQDIIRQIGQLKTDFGRFEDDYRVLGKHIGNAAKAHQTGEKRLTRFADRLTLTSGGGVLPGLEISETTDPESADIEPAEELQ